MAPIKSRNVLTFISARRMSFEIGLLHVEQIGQFLLANAKSLAQLLERDKLSRRRRFAARICGKVICAPALFQFGENRLRV